MSQGIFIHRKRPRFKKEVVEAVATEPESGRLEATSMVGNEYDGPVSEAPEGRYYFVGPDPYTSRKFYGTMVVKNGTVKVT